MNLENKVLHCPLCKSDQIIKAGRTYTKVSGIKQRYKCKICGATFRDSDGYFKGKTPLQIVQYAISLYEQGFSLEKIQIRVKNKLLAKVSRKTIGDWLKKAGVPLRTMSCGDQKRKVNRELVEIGNVTVVRYASSKTPEKIIMLDNFVFTVGGGVVNG